MIQENLEIPAADGVTEALLVRPDSNDPLPAIINLTDGLGFRPAFAEQSMRIAERRRIVHRLAMLGHLAHQLALVARSIQQMPDAAEPVSHD